jgi:hypothetical protein
MVSTSLGADGLTLSALFSCVLKSCPSANFPAMGALSKKQKPVFLKIYEPRISPDDVKYLLIERDRLAATDTRTEAQKWLGDPPPWRSALARRKQHTTGVRDP